MSSTEHSIAAVARGRPPEPERAPSVRTIPPTHPTLAFPGGRSTHATRLSPLGQALVLEALVAEGGARRARLRRDILAGCHDAHPSAGRAPTLERELLALAPADMPPRAELVALLIDALAQRLGGSSRDQAWKHIGIKPESGRGYVARHSRSVRYALFFTLAAHALL